MVPTIGQRNVEKLQKINPETYTYGLSGINVEATLHFSRGLFITLGSLVLILFLVRMFFLAFSRIRLVMTVTTDSSPKSQRYWSTPSTTWVPMIKRHLLYAPIFRNRHNREMQLSAAINMGTLPTRLHLIVLLIYIGSNIFYCTYLIDWSQPKAMLVADFRGRTGVMAVVNMIPLFLLAGRNNPLIDMLHISFDTFNIFHRWMGRIVAFESIAHTIAWFINKHDAMGWSGVFDMMRSDLFIIYGTIGTVAMIALVLHSPSPIRHAFYQFFLVAHVTFIILAVFGIYMHLKIAKVPALKYLQIVIVIWVLERCMRAAKLGFRNLSRRQLTKVKVEAMPGEVSRVTFQLPRPWKFIPGQHVYVYLPAISLWQSHPFSVAWSEHKPAYTWQLDTNNHEKEKEAAADVDYTGPKIHTISLLVAKRTGMTARLYNKAMASENKTYYLRGFVEGPYGGNHCFDSYGTAILVAGGIGVTHQLGYMKELVKGFTDGTVATRKVVMIWVIRNEDQLELIRKWMYDVLPMDGRREVLKFYIFVTKPKRAQELMSPSGSIGIYPGRPNMDMLLTKEIADRVGTVAVSVCGPGRLSDDVRSVVRNQVAEASVDYFEEGFSY